jgi:hypothetical protein
MRLGNDQCRVIVRNGHAIRESEVIRDLPKGAAGRKKSDSRATIDIGIAATVNNNLIPALVRKTSQICMDHQRSINVPAHQ